MPVELNCASSLIAVHQAVVGLRLGEVDVALAGGANAVLSAGITREMADLQLLSPEGRCKSFDAAADGFVRGEGCGIVVLKRLAEAEAAGDRIWAVIRGSAFNQNGATAGATVPNGPAQERLIERALAQAGIAPSEVDYLEAHGAGSAFGDPIEVQAAAAVYGKGRDADRPLLMGSVKTNIGHLETAAGIAGLIKAVLAMKQGVIPRAAPLGESEHARRMGDAAGARDDGGGGLADRLRPPAAGRCQRIWDFRRECARRAGGVRIHERRRSRARWRKFACRRPAAGCGGPAGAGRWACRHLKLASLRAPRGCCRSRPSPDEALRALARRYLSWLDEHEEELRVEKKLRPAPCSRTWRGRPQWAAATWTIARAWCSRGLTRCDMLSPRSRMRTTDPDRGWRRRWPSPTPARPSGWVGMGAALYESEPVFRAVLDRCDARLRDERGEPLLDVMFGQGRRGGRRARSRAGSGPQPMRWRARSPRSGPASACGRAW